MDQKKQFGYHSGQQTLKSAEVWKELMSNNNIELFISSPNFNLPKNKNQKDAWDELFGGEIEKENHSINKPCFGKIIEDMANYSKIHGYEINYSISDFVLEKAIKKSSELLKSLEINGFVNAFNKMSKFIEDLKNILNKSIKINSKEEWNIFLKDHDLLEMNLDLDYYLKNFDNTLNEEQINKIFNYSLDLKNETRWLTKVGYYPIGCFTDVANLIELLNKGIPNFLIMDCENDDLASLKILNSIHYQNNTQMTIYLQLPECLKNDNNSLICILNKIFGDNYFINNDIKLPSNYHFLFDNESKNYNVLKDFYSF